ncbi:hypothetical protein CK203_082485 [Vitis vinifera]|uniref:Uncharacterized protein n=1 Tax=Vitis vinifera TaxID=29760 RepID=A0A438DJZ0_VITVI|nr:hypothetical protein CK203_082485 [Vitis vinifera]
MDTTGYARTPLVWICDFLYKPLVQHMPQGEKLSVIWLEEFSPPQIELNPKLRLARADLWVGLALSANLPKTRSSLQDSFLMIMFRSFKNLSNHIYTLEQEVLLRVSFSYYKSFEPFISTQSLFPIRSDVYYALQDQKDLKIRELSTELHRERKKSAAYQEQLQTILKYIEEHTRRLSLKVEIVVNNLRELESEEQDCSDSD